MSAFNRLGPIWGHFIFIDSFDLYNHPTRWRDLLSLFCIYRELKHIDVNYLAQVYPGNKWCNLILNSDGLAHCFPILFWFHLFKKSSPSLWLAFPFCLRNLLICRLFFFLSSVLLNLLKSTNISVTKKILCYLSIVLSFIFLTFTLNIWSECPRINNTPFLGIVWSWVLLLLLHSV